MFKNTNKSSIIFDLKDYMFTSKNMNKYTKHMTQIVSEPKSSTKNIEQINKEQINIEQINIKEINKEQINIKEINKEQINKEQINKNVVFQKNYKNKIETMYKPKQKDSLFWCFYILKNGFFNYEMEINNQYFVVEKKEKFKYIEVLRKNKDILKIHKIKPLTELEDDLANKDKISIIFICSLFNVVFNCEVCYPVSGMNLNCIAKNITKAGIRAESADEQPSPFILFIARDHYYANEYFNSIEENEKFVARVIAQRFELNDKYVSIGSIIYLTYIYSFNLVSILFKKYLKSI